jgi:hypothetical protein
MQRWLAVQGRPAAAHAPSGGGARNAPFSSTCLGKMIVYTFNQIAQKGGRFSQGILDLDTTGDYVDENGHKESHRYAGLVLTVQIKYTNHGPSMWWCGKIHLSLSLSLFAPSCTTIHHFTKTGSGQTSGKGV